MKFWSLAPEPTPERGFAAALIDLIARKERELAPKWDGLPVRSRKSKARQRALAEMARRIEARTGRRYAVSTLARKASKNELPSGVDDPWLRRWAQVDRAGSVKKLAQRFGTTESQLARWRDQPALKPGETERPVVAPAVPPTTAKPEAPAAPTPAPPILPPEDQLEFDTERGPSSVGVECWGWLICDGKPYRKHIPADFSQEYEWLTVDPDTELELYDAWMAGDMNTLSEILSPLITDQVISTWPHCPPGSYYNADEIVDMHFPADPS